jgi:hypothetical protein
MGKNERDRGDEGIKPRKWTFKGEDLERLLADYGNIAPGKSEEYFAQIADDVERERARIGLIVILGIRIGTTVEGVKRVSVSESLGEKDGKYKIKYTYRLPSRRFLQRKGKGR